MDKISLKTEDDIKKMAEGGKKLARVKHALENHVKVGVNASEIEKLACKLIEKEGAKASFKMVPKYHWATCVNVNEGIVHGIPSDDIVFEKGDVVSVDVGLFYKGFHTDTSLTVGLDVDKRTKKFLGAGKRAIKEAIKQVKPGKRIYDISAAIEEIIKKEGYSPVLALVGHGVGKELHEEPAVPCFTSGKYSDSPEIVPGMVLAIEVMYVLGEPDLVLENDGWTISTRDGKISALYEDSIAVGKKGSLVLTN